MRIVFFGTSNVALPVLEALHKNHEVVAVVTAPNSKLGKKQVLTPSPVSILATELGLNILKPETVKSNAELTKTLAAFNADIFIVVSYGKILPLDIINLPSLKTLNIHFSLLPKYRGAAPIQFALLNGDTNTGTSIFILEEGLDTGPIIAQEQTKIDADDNFITLSEKLAVISARLIIEVLPQYAAGTIVPKPQEGSVTQTKIIAKQDGKIDWNK